jgi:anti-sigma factor RsiW
MKRNPSNAHPDDRTLLAFMDAELPRGTMRSTKQHLEVCWKCRATLAEIELLAQAVSKLLCQEDEFDLARAEKAKAKFIEKKSLFEMRTRRSAIRLSCLLHPHRNESASRWFMQSTLEIA